MNCFGRMASALAVGIVLLPGLAAAQRAYTPADIDLVKGISGNQLSPDGGWIAYELSESHYDENKSSSDIYLIPSDGSQPPRRLTFSGKHNTTPRWAPDGKTLGFISDRDTSLGGQIYLLPLSRPGEAARLTDIHGGVDDFIFSPSGEFVVLAARVYPDQPSLDTAAVRDSVRDASKMKARVHDQLMYRHWSSYDDGKVTHLFRKDLGVDGALTNLTPSLKYDALNYWLASAGREYSLSTDGAWLYFAGNQDEDQAVSYNTEVYRVSTSGGAIEKITTNPAADNCPRPSPDGARLAWRATRRPYYESDQYDLIVRDMKTGTLTNLTDKFDRSVAHLFWSAEGDWLFFEAEDDGDLDLFAVPSGGGEVKKVLGAKLGGGEGYHMGVEMSPDGKNFFFTHRPLNRFVELARYERGPGRVQLLTSHNDSLGAEVFIPPAEDVYFKGAGGTQVHGMLFLPITFDPAKKYPMLVRIHGGPQQMFGRALRNEYALFAGRGYVVFACNPRGSTGYGQEFTDQIRGDWDGKVMEDLLNGVRHVLATRPYVDPKGLVGWGGSFGGFVCNWLEGHNDDKLFATLVSHAGDADQWSAYGSTEELWFPEWEMFGTPWEQPENYDRMSPIRYADKFNTPMLLTHGDLDYRVPITGSEQMFTALQRRGVPSKFIRFPDEGHWILKPQNRRFWYSEILDWSDRWCK